jgi:2-polyprenyl-3-methyl-5-hydroxy-6-metoxy-1,4-benzoquinol methylase
MRINSQYDYMFESNDRPESLGVVSAKTWENDPKRLLFTLARYKFVAKILAGYTSVMEVGCGDAWASRIVAQHVKSLTAIDYDGRFIDAAKKTISKKWPIELKKFNIMSNEVIGEFDAIYLLDVFEHIEPTREDEFLNSVKLNLSAAGVAILGVPSLHSQDFIAPEKRDLGHVNCKSGEDFKMTLRRHFSNVFLFSMNDEVVHTGNTALAHYFIAICCGKEPALK